MSGDSQIQERSRDVARPSVGSEVQSRVAEPKSLAPGPPPSQLESLLTRTSGGARTSVLLALQRDQGNAWVQRLLQRSYGDLAALQRKPSLTAEQMRAEFDALPEVARVVIEGGRDAYVGGGRAALIKQYGSIQNAIRKLQNLEKEFNGLPIDLKASISGGRDAYIKTARAALVRQHHGEKGFKAELSKLTRQEFHEKLPAEMQEDTPGGEKGYVSKFRGALLARFGTIEQAISKYREASAEANAIFDKLTGEEQKAVQGRRLFLRTAWKLWVAGQFSSVGDAAKHTSDASKEFDELPSIMTDHMDGGKQAYVSFIRFGLIAHFGTLDKAKEHYSKVAPHPFLGKSPAPLVHESMAVRLDAAESVLKNRHWLETARASVHGIGGFNIRANVNNKSVLSLHSFGTAVDINASTNPNINDKGKDSVMQGQIEPLVSGLTGQDLQGGSAVTKLRARRASLDELVAAARELRQASAKLEGIFNDKDPNNPVAFKTGMANYVTEQGGVLPSDGVDALFQLIKDAAGDTTRLQQWLGGVGVKDPPRAAVTIGKAYAAFQATFTTRQAKKKGKPPEMVTEKVKAETEGTLGSVAGHGFLDLAPELIGAMTSSEGGNLRWLGAGNKVKDYMHFEIEPTSRK